MRCLKDEKGAISTVVLVSVMLFITVIFGTYMINANIKKAQLKSQILLRDEYADSLTEERDIYFNTYGVDLDDFSYGENAENLLENEI